MKAGERGEICVQNLLLQEEGLMCNKAFLNEQTNKQGGQQGCREVVHPQPDCNIAPLHVTLTFGHCLGTPSARASPCRPLIVRFRAIVRRVQRKCVAPTVSHRPRHAALVLERRLKAVLGRNHFVLFPAVQTLAQDPLALSACWISSDVKRRMSPVLCFCTCETFYRLTALTPSRTWRRPS